MHRRKMLAATIFAALTIASTRNSSAQPSQTEQRALSFDPVIDILCDRIQGAAGYVRAVSVAALGRTDRDMLVAETDRLIKALQTLGRSKGEMLSLLRAAQTAAAGRPMPLTPEGATQRAADWSRLRTHAVKMRAEVDALGSALNLSVTLKRGLPRGVVENIVALMGGKARAGRSVASLDEGQEAAGEDAAVFALLVSKYVRLQQAFVALETELQALQGRAMA